MDKILVGKRIRRQREAFNLTREQFSEQVGISPQFLAEIENGSKGMSAETLCKICEYGGISADYILFGRIGEESNSPTIKMLREIPSQYSILIEDVIRSFRDTVKMPNEERKE